LRKQKYFITYTIKNALAYHNAVVVIVNSEVAGLSPGTDVMIFKVFSPKNSAKKLAILTQNKAKLCKILIITLVFEKNANFFAENCRKSKKIVIITSTPCLATQRIYRTAVTFW
jgi:Ni,Fe-hydrogenase III small subunit